MTETLIAIGCGALAAFLAYAYFKELARRKKAERELREARENEERAAEIIGDANKTKADAVSGDNGRDLEYMAGKLRDYAAK